MRCSPPHRCRAASPSPASGSITPRTPLCWRSAYSRPDMRVGIGYDSHRFAEGEGRKLILGGVEIPHTRGLVGHSDADRSEEHTSELSHVANSYAVFCLKKKTCSHEGSV